MVVGLVPMPPPEAPYHASPAETVPPLQEAPCNVLQTSYHPQRHPMKLMPPLNVPLELRPAVVATASVEQPQEVPLKPSV